MKSRLLSITVSVVFSLFFSNSSYAGPILKKNKLSGQYNAIFGKPTIINKPSQPKAQKSGLVDKGDYYFLNTGEKKSFLRKKNTYLVIFDRKKKLAAQLQTTIQTQFENKLDVIKGHRLGENIMVRVKEGENTGDIVAALSQTDPSIEFVSPVLTGTTASGELAVIPHIVVGIDKDEDPGSVIKALQKNYNLSLVSKLSFTDTEYEFKIEKTVLDIGIIFELTREIAALPYINWAEPNFLVSPIKHFTPNDTLYNNQWHLNNTGQNGAAVDADIDAPEGWDLSTGENTIIAIFDDGVDTAHEDLVIWANPGETGGGKETNGIDDDGNGYIDDYRGWDFEGGDNNPGPALSTDNHGTSVAGVAGARGNNSRGVTGSAVNAAILPVRCGFMTCADYADAMRYAGKYADVVNNSWGIDVACQSALNAAISDVVNGNIAGARRGALGTPVLFATGNSASGWMKFTLSGFSAGTYDFRWKFLKNASSSSGYDTVWLDDITWPGGATTDFESDTGVPSGFTSGGSATWSVVSDGTHARGASGKSVKAGTITHSQDTYLDATRAVGAGDLTFWVWVSSEQDYDFFEFYVDGFRYFQYAPGQYDHENGVGYPASNPDTIAVGASNDGGISGLEERSYYSQFGPEVDVVAPSNGGGQGITTTDRMGTAGYGVSNYTNTFGGTSSATPLAAGVVADLIAYAPTLTASEIRSFLRDGADQIGPYSYAGERNNYYGHGRINLDNSLNLICPDADGDGYPDVSCGGNDCNDSDAGINPGAAEVCDGVDNDCNAGTADGSGETWLGSVCDGTDADLCDEGSYICSGSAQACNDYTGDNVELCDGVDNDCVGGPGADEVDNDGDGYMVCENDCDDTDFTIYPGAPELCDGLDNDCDGTPDDGIYSDNDGDGFSACEGDCNDMDDTIYSSATEICDGKDNDCDLITPTDETTDVDGDGYLACNDCDDTVSSINPGAAEICDGLDNNCDGLISVDESRDVDEDGFLACNDCNDTDSSINPDAADICDGIDNDCDTLIDEEVYSDFDGDTYDDCIDSDDDNDGVLDIDDNCPLYSASTDQTETDGDLVGDVCDNCINTFNPDQANLDFDLDVVAIGDVCDYEDTILTTLGLGIVLDFDAINSSLDTIVTYDEVTGKGYTNVNILATGLVLPDGYEKIAWYREIRASAIFSGMVKVCIKYVDTDMSDEDENTAELLHLEDDTWVYVTTSRNIVNNIICGQVSGFSTFVVGGDRSGDDPGDGGDDGGDGGDESTGPNDGGNGGCFIATAAYGTPLAKEVQVLSRFRDAYLLPNYLGRRLASLYYRLSPPMAKYIKDNVYLKTAVRGMLNPVVWLVEKFFVENDKEKSTPESR